MISTALAFSYVVIGPIISEASVPDSASDKWTFLGVFVTTIVAPVVVYLIGSRALRPTGRRTDDNTVSTERGNSFSVAGMSSNTVEVLLSMWKKIDELEDNQETWANERSEFIRINEELRRHNRALAEGFDEVIDWIDAGSEPPPPSVAQHVRELVQRAIETGSYGGLTGGTEQ